MKKICFTLFIAFLFSGLYAQDFIQSFNAGGSVKDYVSKSPEATSKNKFYSMVTQENVTAGIVNEKLRFARAYSTSDNAGSWVIGGTSSPFNPVPTVAEISMEFEIKDNTNADQRMFLAIGTNIGDPPLPTANPNTHSSFVIKSTSNPGEFTVNNGTNMQAFKGKPTGPYSGKVVFKWVVNNSGNSYSYTAPDGSSEKVADDTWDLYINDTLALNDQPAITPGIQNMTAVKFAFKTNDVGSITVDMDNISVKKLKP